MSPDPSSEATIQGLDHLGIINRELEATAEAYERMGFQLTPWSRHAGSPRGGEPPVLMGTANRCAMFAGGYLELVGVIDPGLPTYGMFELSQRYRGAHIVAFACDDAPGNQRRLEQAGFAGLFVNLLQREIETETSAGKLVFHLIRVPPEVMAEGGLRVIEHGTPALMWQPPWLVHPNGAEALDEVLFCVADRDEAAARFTRFLGHPAGSARADGSVSVSLPRGRLSLVAREDVGRAVPGHEAPAVPSVVAMTVRVADLVRCRSLLRANGVTHQEVEGRLLVPAQAGCGLAVFFQGP
jgi:hypothetical protein